jgi:hypothetical protein
MSKQYHVYIMTNKRKLFMNICGLKYPLPCLLHILPLRGEEKGGGIIGWERG